MKGGHVHNNTHFTGKKKIKNVKKKKKKESPKSA